MAALVHRPDLISLLTTGHALPLQSIQKEHLKVVLDTIFKAWNELLAEGASLLTTGNEPEVTACIKTRLNDYCDGAIFWKDIIGGVGGDSTWFNYDGTKLEKSPDLSLTLMIRNRNFPLIVECKMIDHPNGKTVGMYGNEGIARFINGDYAWATREAIMLAYVRDGSSIDSRLKPHLASSAAAAPDPLMTSTQPQTDLSVHTTAHYSEHGRSFTYTAETDGDEPGVITLWHLWLT